MAIVLALALVVLLSFGERPKFFVPVRFQRSGHERIIRVHAEKAPPHQPGVIAGHGQPEPGEDDRCSPNGPPVLAARPRSLPMLRD